MGKHRGTGWAGSDAVGSRKAVLVMITLCALHTIWAAHFPVAQDHPAGDLSMGVGP